MNQSINETIRSWPDARGRFGEFGGRFVPETLMHPIEELERAWEASRADKEFQAEFQRLLKEYAGRPTPLFHARRLTIRFFLSRSNCVTSAVTRWPIKVEMSF